MGKYSSYKTRGGTSDSSEDAVLNGGMWDAFDGVTQSHVISGFTATISSLNLTIATGTIYVAGRKLVTTESTVVSVGNSATTYVYIKRDGTYETNTTQSAPDDSFLLYTVVAAGGSITSATLSQQSAPITTSNIQNSSITSGKIVDGSITEAKLGAGAVTETKLAQQTGITEGTYTNPSVTVNNRGLVTGISSGSVALTDLSDVSLANPGHNSIVSFDINANKFVSKDASTLIVQRTGLITVSGEFTHEDFAVGGGVGTHTISSVALLPAGAIIVAFKIKSLEAFAAPDLSAAVVQLEIGTTNIHSGTTNVYNAVSATNYTVAYASQVTLSNDAENQIDLELTLTGDNVNDLTAGVVGFSISYVNLQI